MTDRARVTVQGGCHCGAVRFEAQVESGEHVVHRCNCSICAMTGFVHLIVAGDQFRLMQGGDALREYRFNTEAARHLFCSRCGVKSFYVPRSHPTGYSINVTCLDHSTGITLREEPFDGQRWEASIAALRDGEAS